MKDEQSKNRPDLVRRALSLSALGVMGVGTLALAGCGGSDDEDTAQLRFANATPDRLTFRYNGQRATDVDGYGGVSNFGEIDTGGTNVAIRTLNGSADLASSSVNAAKDSFLSALAYGTLASPRVRFFEENSSQPGSGDTRIRFFHANSTNAPLNVYLTSLSGPLNTPTFQLAGYEALSDFATISGGNSNVYRIRITPQDSTTTVLFDSGASSPGVTFSGRSVITLVVAPSNSGSFLNLMVLPEQAGGGRIDNVLF